MRDITDTGIRGYLRWLQADQPNLYVAVAPIIAQRVPDAFSDHEQSLAQRALMGLGDDSDPGTTTYFGDSTDTFDSSSGASTPAVSASPDVASAANTGAASSGIISDIMSIVNSVANFKLAQTQQKNTANAYAQLNATQAARVSAGLPPLAVSSNSLGIPLITGTGSAPIGTGTMLAFAGLGILALMMAGGRGRA